MFTYKSEILKTTIKWGLDQSARKTDVSNLDDLINRRTAEGWEFVTHSYMANVWGGRSGILVKFRKEK